ncbi:BnaC08g21950D [Brassica napus]|uniref:BnaC08g21950D protein n=1 Tax=Brassica napus TaxID=3708 RepID=A0A078FYA6_BRANA|nr:BnaC08g21950D [Brassica napus]
MDESDGRYICILAHVGKTTLADHLRSKQCASPEASCLMLTLYPSGEITDESLELLEDDEEVTFHPQKGNVCALDGWGFGVSELANFYASKLGAKADGVLGSLSYASKLETK